MLQVAVYFINMLCEHVLRLLTRGQKLNQLRFHSVETFGMLICGSMLPSTPNALLIQNTISEHGP